jgi:hypothetical protein
MMTDIEELNKYISAIKTDHNWLKDILEISINYSQTKNRIKTE